MKENSNNKFKTELIFALACAAVSSLSEAVFEVGFAAAVLVVLKLKNHLLFGDDGGNGFCRGNNFSQLFNARCYEQKRKSRNHHFKHRDPTREPEPYDPFLLPFGSLK